MKNKLIAITLSGLMLAGSTNGLAMEPNETNNNSILAQTLEKSKELLKQYNDIKALYKEKNHKHCNQNIFLSFLYNFRLKLFQPLKKLNDAAKAVKKQKANTVRKLEGMNSKFDGTGTFAFGILSGLAMVSYKQIFKKIDSKVDSIFAAKEGWLKYKIENFIDNGPSEFAKNGAKTLFLITTSLLAARMVGKIINKLKTSEIGLASLLANKNNELEKEIENLDSTSKCII